MIELVNEVDVGEVEELHYGTKSLVKNLCDDFEKTNHFVQDSQHLKNVFISN